MSIDLGYQLRPQPFDLGSQCSQLFFFCRFNRDAIKGFLLSTDLG
jgi:hypothetical protein